MALDNNREYEAEAQVLVARLSSMGMARFFRPDLKGCRSGGKAACLTVFEALRHRHWVNACPDRKMLPVSRLFAEARLKDRAK